MFHLNTQTFFNRAVFLPILAALISISLAGLSASSQWSHSFGLGGLFGDTILDFLINSVSSRLGIKEILITILSNVLSFSVALFVFGFDLLRIF